MAIIWAEEHPREADRLADLHARFGLQVYTARRQESGLWSEPAEPYLNNDELAEARSCFGDECAGLWTGHTSLAELVTEAAESEGDPYLAKQIRVLFDVVVRWSDSMFRATGLSNRAFRESAPDDTGMYSIIHGPSKQQVADALFLASTAYLPPHPILKVTFATRTDYCGELVRTPNC